MSPPSGLLVWSKHGRSIIGSGHMQRHDPGTGPGRYRRALELLRSSGSDLGFASFTFDPDTPGSVVIVPETVEFDRRIEAKASSQPTGTVSADGKEAWQHGMETALAALEKGRVEKVVLTRQVTLEYPSTPSTDHVAAQLIENQPDCYVFAVDRLVGASPELLVSHQGGVISSLVLAGTAPSAEGLGSEKMDLEHVLAVSSVRDGISPYVLRLETPSRSVLEFGEIKHLATSFTGPAVNGSTVMDLLAALHPTASVAGTPTPQAMELIREIEPSDRGRYAGPVGWFTPDGEGEFAIALRCGLVEDGRVTLFAGGGLVDGSDEVSEFAETELKLRPMMVALGAE